MFRYANSVYKSFEMGEHNGLNLIDGTVEKINKTSNDKGIKVPHISWNEIFLKKIKNLKLN